MESVSAIQFLHLELSKTNFDEKEISYRFLKIGKKGTNS